MGRIELTGAFGAFVWINGVDIALHTNGLAGAIRLAGSAAGAVFHGHLGGELEAFQRAFAFRRLADSLTC